MAKYRDWDVRLMVDVMDGTVLAAAEKIPHVLNTRHKFQTMEGAQTYIQTMIDTIEDCKGMDVNDS